MRSGKKGQVDGTIESDHVFTMLMGEEAEPRALRAVNIDVQHRDDARGSSLIQFALDKNQPVFSKRSQAVLMCSAFIKRFFRGFHFPIACNASHGEAIPGSFTATQWTVASSSMP